MGPLSTQPLSKFLGVTIGRALSFRPYVAAVVFKAPNRCQIPASPTSKMWGWRKDQLLKVYQAIHLFVINYAAKTEHSGLSPSLLRPSELRQESRASQHKPNNKPSWPTRRPIVPQQTILTRYCPKNRAATVSNDQAGALRPMP